MSTQIRRRDGGFATFPNRWIDAGYMAQAPGSVTQVYLFLCRWADNSTLSAAQPMRTIARKCGVSEDIARKAVRILEAWGAITREPETGPKAVNVWTLNDLAQAAPDYPDKVPPKQSRGPQQTGGSEKLGSYQPEDLYQPNSTPHAQESVFSPRSGSMNQPEGTKGADAPVPSKTKPLPTNGPAQKIVKAYCETVGIERPAAYGKAVGQAQKLADAGITPEQVPDLVRWLQGEAWIKGAIDLGTMLANADKWRAASRPAHNLPDDVTMNRGETVEPWNGEGWKVLREDGTFRIYHPDFCGVVWDSRIFTGSSGQSAFNRLVAAAKQERGEG